MFVSQIQSGIINQMYVSMFSFFYFQGVCEQGYSTFWGTQPTPRMVLTKGDFASQYNSHCPFNMFKVNKTCDF